MPVLACHSHLHSAPQSLSLLLLKKLSFSAADITRLECSLPPRSMSHQSKLACPLQVAVSMLVVLQLAHILLGPLAHLSLLLMLQGTKGGLLPRHSQPAHCRKRSACSSCCSWHISCLPKIL